MSLSTYRPDTVPLTLADGISISVRAVNKSDVIAAITASPIWPQAAALIADKVDINDWSTAEQVQAVLLVLVGFQDALSRIVASVTGEPVDVVAGLPLGVPLRIIEAALTA